MSEGAGRTLADIQAIAAAKGLVVRVPAENELFIDIDDDESMAVCDRGFEILSQAFGGGCTYKRTPSPSGKPDRFHVVVTLPRPVNDDFERILLQAALGSDRKHELLSWVTADDGGEAPTVLFEKPDSSVPLTMTAIETAVSP